MKEGDYLETEWRIWQAGFRSSQMAEKPIARKLRPTTAQMRANHHLCQFLRAPFMPANMMSDPVRIIIMPGV